MAGEDNNRAYAMGILNSISTSRSKGRRGRGGCGGCNRSCGLGCVSFSVRHVHQPELKLERQEEDKQGAAV